MLVSNIMMAHIETNNWSKLLTFISGHKQICPGPLWWNAGT
jgi:hypothetical protein